MKLSKKKSALERDQRDKDLNIYDISETATDKLTLDASEFLMDENVENMQDNIKE